MAGKEEIEKCPKAYVKWLFVILGMIFAFIGYLTYSNIAGSNAYFDEEMYDQADQSSGQAPIINTSRDEETPLSSVFLGVEVMSLDSVIAKQLNISSKNGVFIRSVIPDSPAYQAGLKRGDLIIAVNNRTVKDIDRFKQIIAELNPGDRVRIVYIREAKKTSTYAVLEKPAAFQKIAQAAYSSSSDTLPFLGVSSEQAETADWGVSLSPLSAVLRDSFNIPSDISGVMVLSVSPGGPADEAGLMPGDVITGIDKTPVAAMDDFFQAIFSDRDTTALLDIYSQGRMRYLPIDSSSITVTDQTQTQDKTTLRQRLFSLFDRKSLLLAEHINEEDEYEKPVCKRLEESGERYDQQDVVTDGKI